MIEIKEELKEHLLSEQEEDREEYKKTDNIFHASECSVCPRFCWFERKEPIDETLDTLQIFQIGKIVHKFFQENVLKGINEQKCSYKTEDFEIRGKADIVIDDLVIELKSCKNINYIFVPKEEHIKQLNLYLGLLKHSKGKIVYIDKTNFKINEFEIFFDRELFDDTIEDFKSLYDCIKNITDFREVEAKISPYCFYCKYCKTKCFPRKRRLKK